mmetsp:Transcript_72704/g.151784  ORF Transcript_72704/g.151784 Transcript_72704/m.151784 type:complete len:436 (-) Transcript_72704:265-1572(-)|eukprot:CAMPEP_0206463848 /NCGR_PEP_ID=MMETSP0324_2-20121206/26859_1 /ASSEMBLY_ACC=CAM_ASM_000836 /TAXON_ID=2866 /ORGANISM="Crypthecodinium cohnii, Strain Seligo" /LENGTH=435 /DNA_ID=CAMNT_0053936355 /DNA_START=232 /DNA_END=1542 /DNA_ORIENTATION=+
MIIVGICLEILAAALGTMSKQLIAYSSYSNKRWVFHVGAFTNIAIGPLVDASAYAFAPQVVVAPFACLDVIFNMIAAPYTLGWQQEQIGRYHILGTLLVALGACLTSVFGSVQDENLDSHQLQKQLFQPSSIVYLLTEATGLIVVGFGLWVKLVPADWRGIALGCTAGVLMGNVFFLKGFIGIFTTCIATGDWEAFLGIFPYICIAASLLGSLVGHLVMRQGLKEYKGVYMVTIFEGAHITAGCLSGCIIMDEMSSAGWLRMCGYWASVLGIISGILLVNKACGASLGSEPMGEVANPNEASTMTTPLADSEQGGGGAGGDGGSTANVGGSTLTPSPRASIHASFRGSFVPRAGGDFWLSHEPTPRSQQPTEAQTATRTRTAPMALTTAAAGSLVSPQEGDPRCLSASLKSHTGSSLLMAPTPVVSLTRNQGVTV